MIYFFPPQKIFFISLCFFFFSGCLSTEYNPGTHKQDIYFYSTESEIGMGQNLCKKIAKEFEVSLNPYDIQRVNSIGSKIVDVCDRREINYYFYVINKKDEVNAFALPGGYVYIYKDLLDKLDDDELAYVLAHEIGHIVSRHSIKRLQAAIGYNALVLVSTRAPNADANFSGGLAFALAQILAGYSREDELNADEQAVEYAKLAGFKPAAGILVMEKLDAERKKKTQPISYFRTHPYTAERIRTIKEKLKLPLSVDDYINSELSD